MGKIIGKINPSVKQYLLGNDWNEDSESQIVDDYIKAGKLFLEIMGYCWT